MQEHDVYDLLVEATLVENIVSTENRILDKWGSPFQFPHPFFHLISVHPFILDINNNTVCGEVYFNGCLSRFFRVRLRSPLAVVRCPPQPDNRGWCRTSPFGGCAGPIEDRCVVTVYSR